MRAKKVYESIFKPKTKEEIKRDLPYGDFKGMVNIGNGRTFTDFPGIDFPLISDIWVKLYKENIHPFKKDVRLTYSEPHGRWKKSYWVIIIKYKNKRFFFMQEEGNDYLTPTTAAGNPLYIHKIHSFEELENYIEENYYVRKQRPNS